MRGKLAEYATEEHTEIQDEVREPQSPVLDIEQFWVKAGVLKQGLHTCHLCVSVENLEWL